MNLSPFVEGDKVVGYCRYSGGEEQGLKNTSTDEQEAAIRRFCEQNGLNLVKVYADPFVSGRSTKGREHYMEMMSDLLHAKRKKSDIAGLIAWDFERLHRNMDQAQLDAARLRMAGYKIYSIQQPVMDNGPFARVMEAMYFASAQNQSDMISADVRRALQSNFLKYKVIPRHNIPYGWVPVPVSMGLYTNGQPRSGYKAEPDPELLPRIRQAIMDRMEGATMDEMKATIGGVFRDKPRELIRRLMLKPLLYGSFTFGGQTIEDYCEQIIDKDTFDRLQLYNKYAPKEHAKPQGHYSQNRPLLSNMLYCGVCGKKAFVDRRRAKGHLYETYYCNDKHVGFKMKLLDDLVIEKGIELLSDEHYKSTVIAMLEAAKSPFQAEPNNRMAENEIAKLDQKIARISSAIENSDDCPATLVKRLSELEKQRADLALSISSAEDPDARNKVLEECERIRQHILNVLKSEKSSTDDLRTALSLFIHSVVIYPGSKVMIRYTLPGFANVASNTSDKVTAPPEAGAAYSQLFEKCYQAAPASAVPALM